MPSAAPSAVDTASASGVAPTPTEQRLPDGRTFLLYAPADSTPRPLVVALHSAYHDAAWFATASGLTRLAAEDHFVVAYGQGLGNVWNAGGCCGQAQADDVAYLDAVVQQASRLAYVDRNRVYLIGLSNGAMMAYRAICEQPDVFAAAGVVAGALMPGVDCRRSVVHVLHIHGTADKTVPLSGGIGFQHIDFPPASTELQRVGPGSTVRLVTWSGGHAYPAWASTMLWTWLSHQSLSSPGTS